MGVNVCNFTSQPGGGGFGGGTGLPSAGIGAGFAGVDDICTPSIALGTTADVGVSVCNLTSALGGGGFGGATGLSSAGIGADFAGVCDICFSAIALGTTTDSLAGT